MMPDFMKNLREKRNEESRAIVRSLREKHNRINESMERFTGAVTPFSGFEIPIGELQEAGVPRPILDHLQHESLVQVRVESERRKEITAEVNAALDRLEENPEANRHEVVNILKLFKEAEDSIVASHDIDKGEIVYQTVYDITASASAAIDMLKEQKKLPDSAPLRKSQEQLEHISEYCRTVSDRHAIWANQRAELKGIAAKLAESTGVDVDKTLLDSPAVYDVYVGIDAHPKKIESMARHLLKGV